MKSDATIPVALFTYARPGHLSQVLACLRENRVPLIHAFADGARSTVDRDRVIETRALLRAIDWCEVRVTERPENLGLGRNVLAGVSAVAERHEAFIVWEDDLVCVPGTYGWLCAALRNYADEPRVMSVTAWTHPRVTPAEVGEMPYCDGRAECWVWGAYARSWRGMDKQTASQKMAAAKARGIPPEAYGPDLPAMARVEKRKNIWAVRWLYHHLAYGGLCVRPPWSMVEHIGFDAQASHAAQATEWENPPLRPAPPIPGQWPEPSEHPECRNLWHGVQSLTAWPTRVRQVVKKVVPPALRTWARRAFGWRWFHGNYATWAEARAHSDGYDDRQIVQRVLAATRVVRAGRAAFERDGVLFDHPVPERALVAALHTVARSAGGRLRVLDFGGALGTTYWRHRHEFGALSELRWDVVEQPRFVAVGRGDLADSSLRFFDSIDAAREAGPHDVLLASTVVQYLENPHVAVADWRTRGYEWILFNNLPLHTGAPDRLAVQRVPPAICPGSYPVWFFNRERFLAALNAHYEITAEFRSEAVWPVGWRDYPSTGLLWRRRRNT